MSWCTPILLTHDERSVSAQLLTDTYAMTSASAVAALSGGLGSARAGGQWAWVDAPACLAATAAPMPASARETGEGSCVRAPIEVLRRMSAAAQAQGRSESDVWVEAAREWLRRREIAPTPPPAASAPSVPTRRIARIWDDIDALLVELRAPAATHEHDDAPAA